ncbi:hypothetical protein HMPREF9180_0001 [Streptococcus peroris ATCC 700780]|uniref:Uncharacterized protein n=1 Tax=Streptococcus peroris ATCC 700780 TaxID=888746 RepID=E8K946_9STRE|nr:hypothetical protein HMPREF9180_0001 [Streptococcus peroris ATCC 700780]
MSELKTNIPFQPVLGNGNNSHNNFEAYKKPFLLIKQVYQKG